MVLPEGTKRTQGFKYEEIDVPAPRKSEAPRGKLVPVGSLPEWAQMAFEGTTHLNTVQSIVFNKAFGSTSNLLVSAPTGAGKTNVAMLTILQAIEANRDAFGAVLSPKEFKMVYIAPMKALVAEVVEKFSSRLAPLGIEVKEMTGDMQLTRQELERVHLIVTVPEKFDILTRNTATGAGREDSSLMSKVALIIIDEVHLLNDDRGPVIESIVARAKRYMETSGAFIRLVAISATLPNWTDVAQFFHVPADHAFHFDSSYRPIPLQQTFIGVAEKDPQRRLHRMNELCYEKIKAAISSGHQAMVFVHSRGDTYTAAKALMEIASAKGDLERFLDHENRADIVRRIRSPQVLELVPSGFAMHHAGMLRSDRSNVERLFMTGCIKVLCCTATLAWGVNLPARTVVIRGSSIFDSKHGGFRDIDVLDILQVFGRAGRPQFDDLGHAVLITSHDKLDSYLMKINNQIPIESKMLDNMCNALNAEIAMNNIADINDAIDYLGYTYLFVRMARSPHVYGIKPEELLHDPHLIAKRRDIVTSAVKKLDANKLLRLSNQQLAPTAIGRIAARYYIDYETTGKFVELLAARKEMTDAELLELFGTAEEFAQLKVREEEQQELGDIAESCPVRVRGGPEHTHGKVGLLLQAYINRIAVSSSSLVSDLNFVQQSASRVMRAMFEITLTENVQNFDVAPRLLEWCKMIDRRLSVERHILHHFCSPSTIDPHHSRMAAFQDVRGLLKHELVHKIEHRRLDLDRIHDMTAGELGNVLSLPAAGKVVFDYARRIPSLNIDVKLQPIAMTIVRITATITADFKWTDTWSGVAEPFKVWVEYWDAEGGCTQRLHSEDFTLLKKDRSEQQSLSFAVPVPDNKALQYTLKVVSDRWVGLSFEKTFTLPRSNTSRIGHKTTLLPLTPLPVTALNHSAYESLFRFPTFNPIQSQVFHAVYHTDNNILLGAPTGSGKTIVAELAMFRVFSRNPKALVVYVSPLKALARERMKDWSERIDRQLGKKVHELTGDFTPDISILDKADVVVTTPEKWDGISRQWQHRDYVQRVSLVVIDEIHLLGQDRGPVLEVDWPKRTAFAFAFRLFLTGHCFANAIYINSN